MFSQWDDVGILARTAFGENRAGGIDGMQSVLNVIMNRAARPCWWGNTPREVCLKYLQFSCWNPTDPNCQVIMNVTDDNTLFSAATALAQQALNGTLEDITNGATYYLAESLTNQPSWAISHTPCATIAGQVFFNDID